MRETIVILLIAAVVLLAIIFDAVAQPALPCGNRAAIVARLAEGYGESLQERSVGDNGVVVYEFWASAKGSWTLIMTTPQGVACLIAAGHGWKPGEGA